MLVRNARVRIYRVTAGEGRGLSAAVKVQSTDVEVTFTCNLNFDTPAWLCRSVFLFLMQTDPPASCIRSCAFDAKKKAKKKLGCRWTEGGESEMMAADAEETGGRTDPCAPPGISLRRRGSDRRWRLRSVYLQCCEYRHARAMTDTRTRCCCCILCWLGDPNLQSKGLSTKAPLRRVQNADWEQTWVPTTWTCTPTPTGTSEENPPTQMQKNIHTHRPTEPHAYTNSHYMKQLLVS